MATAAAPSWTGAPHTDMLLTDYCVPAVSNVLFRGEQQRDDATKLSLALSTKKYFVYKNVFPSY